MKSNFSAISFTGGEPFIDHKIIFELLDYAGKEGVRYLRSGTNGFMFARNGKPVPLEEAELFIRRLAETKIRNFWISIDSSDTKTHETMRGLPGVIAGIENALPIFHTYGIYPAANLGINRNILGTTILPLNGTEDEGRFFEEFSVGFHNFFQKVIHMGFTMANLCYPMSRNNENINESAYGAISDDSIVSFSRRELMLIFQALLEIIPIYRERIRIFTPLSALYGMAGKDSSLVFPCLGGIRYFYMNSLDGHIYPCGFRGEEDLGCEIGTTMKQRNRTQKCFRCHWECFMDPSQLFGIGNYILRHPLKVIFHKRKASAASKSDSELFRLWFADIKYYLHCHLVDGRRPFFV